MGLLLRRVRRRTNPSATRLGRVTVSLCALLFIAAALPGAGPAQPTIYEVLNLPPGAGLRRAIEALEAGYEQRAEALLRGIAVRHPIVGDHADLLRMHLLVDAERYEDAVHMRAERSRIDSPLDSEFDELLGRAYTALRDEPRARRAWQNAVEFTKDSDLRASLYSSLARSYEASGDLAAAAKEYLRVWTRYPLSPEAEAANGQLDVLSARLEKNLRTPNHHRQRGDSLFRKRRNEEALAEYQFALASGGLSPSERRRAERQLADTLFRLRRYDEATIAYSALPQEEEIRINWARSIVRAGSVMRGAEELEGIGKRSRSRHALRANYLAALLLDGEGESDRARVLFESVLEAGKSSHANAALWRLGWAAYREGDYVEALTHFERLERLEDDPIARLRVRYWSARAKERSGRRGAAERAFAAIASEYPLSYYGWRSLPRADGWIDEGRPIDVRRGRSVLEEPDFERVRILLEAGLAKQVRAELNRLFVRARSLDDRVGLAGLYADVGDYHRPQRLMVDAYTEVLAQRPDPSEIELWWHAWPAPFSKAVRGATSDHQRLGSELLYAIMREESGYRPNVVSVSGARGLLQLMPETASRVARENEMGEVSVEDLFLPNVNIQLGAALLEDLLDRFGDRASAAIASYNAGPTAVTKWLARSNVADDEWVEEIPYDQTRGYVKRVLRSMHAYRVLY